MTSTDGLMVGVSGIRGRVAAGLTPEVVATYASAFGAWAIRRGKSKSVVVGRDSRVSGPMFHRVVLSALQSVGCNVIDIGLTTTPTCQLAVEHHHAAGGSDDLGEPQSDRVERAEVHRTVGAVSRGGRG